VWDAVLILETKRCFVLYVEPIRHSEAQTSPQLKLKNVMALRVFENSKVPLQ
jgi:hypothetical protein